MNKAAAFLVTKIQISSAWVLKGMPKFPDLMRSFKSRSRRVSSHEASVKHGSSDASHLCLPYFASEMNLRYSVRKVLISLTQMHLHANTIFRECTGSVKTSEARCEVMMRIQIRSVLVEVIRANESDSYNLCNQE